MRSRLTSSGREPTPANVAAALREVVGVVGDAEVSDVLGALRSELAGAGPLEPLLRRPGVTDVLVNGPGEVWIDHGRGLQRAPVTLADEAAVRRLAQRLAASAGRRLDDAAPWVDAQLPGGVRLHAVLPPLARDGTVISLRVPARRSFTLDELEASGSVTPRLAAALRALVRRRAALLVTGGTGSGKTTLLGCLLGLVDPAERIVLVEDSAELAPEHPHVVRLEARRGNVEGAGEVRVRDLVRQALRMRPDRIVVGEVRGAEVVDLLAALNTGHEGGCGTVHANAPADLPARLEALALAAGLDRPALHSQLGAGLHAVVHVARGPAGREVAGVAAVVPGADGLVRVVPALDRQGRPGPGRSALARFLDGDGDGGDGHGGGDGDESEGEVAAPGAPTAGGAAR
ncbi:MAG TPA: TadA family conjugal transfer-associated ATPase [Motilibacteraceae bacterium]|nr:TadA family conjugal transfer-associated ATPase [Motilibacteraceae bacterium]